MRAVRARGERDDAAVSSDVGANKGAGEAGPREGRRAQRNDRMADGTYREARQWTRHEGRPVSDAADGDEGWSEAICRYSLNMATACPPPRTNPAIFNRRFSDKNDASALNTSGSPRHDKREQRHEAQAQSPANATDSLAEQVASTKAPTRGGGRRVAFKAQAP